MQVGEVISKPDLCHTFVPVITSPLNMLLSW